MADDGLYLKEIVNNKQTTYKEFTAALEKAARNGVLPMQSLVTNSTVVYTKKTYFAKKVEGPSAIESDTLAEYKITEYTGDNKPTDKDKKGMKWAVFI